MAAWGLIRFYCSRCGETFWCHPAEQHGRPVCHDCAQPMAPLTATLASRLKNVQTTAHIHE
jgi:NAD-dependent SIR2 family protein deacetylase